MSQSPMPKLANEPRDDPMFRRYGFTPSVNTLLRASTEPLLTPASGRMLYMEPKTPSWTLAEEPGRSQSGLVRYCDEQEDTSGDAM
jgi:hypothetical protein